MKNCRRCGCEKPTSAFTAHKGTKDGLHSYCRECVAEYSIEWRARNPEKWRAANDNWRKNNPEKQRERQRIDTAKKLSTPRGKLENAFRSRIYQEIVRGSKSGGRTFALLGYTVEELMHHLCRQFEPWMTWHNYGEWHVDHIIPLSAFNYETPYDLDFKRAWALSNLRPLAANDNLRKGDKLDAPFQPSLALAIR